MPTSSNSTPIATPAQDAVRVRSEGEQLIGKRYGQGLETRSAYERAHAGRAAAEAQLAALDEGDRPDPQRHRRPLGQGPDRGLAIARPAPGAIRAFGLPQNLAADLVGRRPDLVAARLAAEAAGQRIKAAKADFYPNVNLMGFIGAQSLGLDTLLRSGSCSAPSGRPSACRSSAAGGWKGAYRGARADYDAAVAAYDATLTQALREVADAAVSSRALDARLAKSREALTASETAYDLARQRYASGSGPTSTCSRPRTPWSPTAAPWRTSKPAPSPSTWPSSAPWAAASTPDPPDLPKDLPMNKPLNHDTLSSADAERQLAEPPPCASSRRKKPSSGWRRRRARRRGLRRLSANVASRHAVTDNAYVDAETAQVTALTSGPVAEVRVVDTQAVGKGDVLVVLDDADRRLELEQAQSALGPGRTQDAQPAGQQRLAERAGRGPPGRPDPRQGRVAARPGRVRPPPSPCRQRRHLRRGDDLGEDQPGGRPGRLRAGAGQPHTAQGARATNDALIRACRWTRTPR
jgi:hypothetical protein